MGMSTSKGLPWSSIKSLVSAILSTFDMDRTGEKAGLCWLCEASSAATGYRCWDGFKEELMIETHWSSIETDTGLGGWTWDDLAEAEPEEDSGGKTGNMLNREEDSPKIYSKIY